MQATQATASMSFEELCANFLSRYGKEPMNLQREFRILAHSYVGKHMPTYKQMLIDAFKQVDGAKEAVDVIRAQPVNPENLLRLELALANQQIAEFKRERATTITVNAAMIRVRAHLDIVLPPICHNPSDAYYYKLPIKTTQISYRAARYLHDGVMESNGKDQAIILALINAEIEKSPESHRLIAKQVCGEALEHFRLFAAPMMDSNTKYKEAHYGSAPIGFPLVRENAIKGGDFTK